MKKLLGIVVFSLLLSNLAISKEIYLQCKHIDIQNSSTKKIFIKDRIFDDKAKTLTSVRADLFFEIKQSDGTTVKKQMERYPMDLTNLAPIDNLPLKLIKEDSSFYYFGGQLFRGDKKTYDEIMFNNRNNDEKMQYSIGKLNKYTLELFFTSFYYPYTYQEMYHSNYNYPKDKTLLMKVEGKNPHKCKILKNKI